MKRFLQTVYLATVLASAVGWTASFAQAMPMDVLPQDRRGDVVLAELILSSASFAMAIHNTRGVQLKEPSLPWSLAGIAMGVGALSAAASSDAELPAFDVIGGMSSVFAGAARLALHRQVLQLEVSGHAIEVTPGDRCVAGRMRF